MGFDQSVTFRYGLAYERLVYDCGQSVTLCGTLNNTIFAHFIYRVLDLRGLPNTDTSKIRIWKLTTALDPEYRGRLPKPKVGLDHFAKLSTIPNIDDGLVHVVAELARKSYHSST